MWRTIRTCVSYYPNHRIYLAFATSFLHLHDGIHYCGLWLSDLTVKCNYKRVLLSPMTNDCYRWHYLYTFNLYYAICRQYPEDANIECMSISELRSTQEVIGKHPVPTSTKGQSMREDFLNFHFTSADYGKCIAMN